MVYRSKIDSFFIKFLITIILILGISSLFPLAIEKNPDLLLIVMLVGVFISMAGFVLWSFFTIEYRFTEDHLFVKGGPFRSRIAYKDILKVSSTTAVFSGHRVLSAKNSIEIFYSNAMLGSVKISPYDQKAFMVELKKRCPILLDERKVEGQQV